MTKRKESAFGYQSVDKGPKGTPRWDIFELPTPKVKRRNDESLLILIPLKIMKLLCYLACCTFVLGTSTMANITLLLMTSQEANNRTMDLCVQETNPRYVVNTPAVERMGWIWSIWFTIFIPEILVLLKCVWTCIFKSYANPSISTFLMVFLCETLQTVGISIMLYDVFPNMNVMQAVMLTNAFGLVPGALLLLSRKTLHYKVVLDLVAMSFIVGGLGVWATVEQSWQIPTAAILISFGWWENFVDEDSKNPFLQALASMRKELKSENCRYIVYVFIAIWKILLSFSLMLIYVQVDTGETTHLLPLIHESFGRTQITITQKWQTAESAIQGVTGSPLFSDEMLPLYISLVQVASALMCYFVTLFACKICVQEFGFSFPISLSIPLSVLVTSGLCSYRMEDKCFLTGIEDESDRLLPSYVFWTCPEGDFVKVFWLQKYGWVWLLWLFAQCWISLHIWTPHMLKRASTERLFVNPLYTGSIISQSMIFNRRKHRPQRKVKVEEAVRTEAGAQYEDLYEVVQTKKEPKARTKIYGCATMWHETAEEMLEMLKSIMRLDMHLRDQRDLSDVFFDAEANDYFDFELHIFFDDAFKAESKSKEVPSSTGTKKINLNSHKVMRVNDYVKTFVKVMGKAASRMYPDNITAMKPPKKVLTPYGGRLEWILPGETPVTIHLKNKDLIRHKKRWSQVMYMYYLLGYLMLDPKNDPIKNELEENTFVLALDGDIDFKPGAITKLLDLMSDTSLGAACGRIHPIGAGPIVWYQKFEYAIGHWLQKATEHVIGCVLCSPGCFSLFRAKALLEVMKTYSTKAEEALHYVQYDQGEDRWLCTLILKRGYRIEYSAASDAYTHAPESFGEFYTQRRRWGPSTMANILDLLKDYKETVRINNSISKPYIIYQGMVMMGTIVGPGTIFLMVVGSIVAAFKVDNWTAFVSNIVPIIFFILTCFYAKNEYQIIYAMILSSCYALLMMAVLVGTAIQLTDDGITSPSGIFLVAITLSFIISAMLHPQEFFCIAHGFLYFLCVPSMYLLLTIYSLINLNVVSWGTREDPTKKAEEEAQKKTEVKKTKLSGVAQWMGIEEEGSFFKKLCECSCCTSEKPTLVEEMKLLEENHNAVEEINRRIVNLERNTELIVEKVTENQPVSNKNSVNDLLVTIASSRTVAPLTAGPAAAAATATAPPVSSTPEIDITSWVNDEDLLRGPTLRLEKKEESFWRRMIDKYLLPLDKDENQEKKAAAELIELRNKVVFGFIMVNGLFILIVFLLQMNKDKLFINWPVNPKINFTYIPDSQRITIGYQYLELEPIGMVFAIFFGVILLYQFFAMLAHRFGTFTHIMASTSLSWDFEESQEVSTGGLLDDNDDDEEEEALNDSGQNRNYPKMPLNPVNRHVSEYYLNKNTANIQLFDTLHEANKVQIKDKLQQNLKKQDSGQSKVSNNRRLSRSLTSQSFRKKMREKGFLSEESSDEQASSSRKRTSQTSSGRTPLSRQSSSSVKSNSGRGPGSPVINEVFEYENVKV